jgi:hypothetical protein
VFCGRHGDLVHSEIREPSRPRVFRETPDRGRCSGSAPAQTGQKTTNQWSGFDVRYPANRIEAKRTSNPKLHWNQCFASGPLIPTFANVFHREGVRMLESGH